MNTPAPITREQLAELRRLMPVPGRYPGDSEYTKYANAALAAIPGLLARIAALERVAEAARLYRDAEQTLMKSTFGNKTVTHTAKQRARSEMWAALEGKDGTDGK